MRESIATGRSGSAYSNHEPQTCALNTWSPGSAAARSAAVTPPGAMRRGPRSAPRSRVRSAATRAAGRPRRRRAARPRRRSCRRDATASPALRSAPVADRPRCSQHPRHRHQRRERPPRDPPLRVGADHEERGQPERASATTSIAAARDERHDGHRRSVEQKPRHGPQRGRLPFRDPRGHLAVRRKPDGVDPDGGTGRRQACRHAR